MVKRPTQLKLRGSKKQRRIRPRCVRGVFRAHTVPSAEWPRKQTAMQRTIRTELSDGSIRIRAYRQDDVDALFEAVSASIPEVSAWLPWCHAGYAHTDSASWVASRPVEWETGTEYAFAVEETSSSTFLGGCGLNAVDPHNKCANLGYWVRTSHAGHGVATRAARLAAQFGFEDLGLQRIEILVAEGNKASQRVAQKIGARKEARLRKRFLLQGRTQDGLLYSLLPEDMVGT